MKKDLTFEKLVSSIKQAHEELVAQAAKELCKNNLAIWHPILGQSLNVLV